MAADHVARIEAQHRADVARQVLDGLNGEKTAAETALAEARTELEAAARGVLGTEVEAVVARVSELELESMANRIQLEGANRSGSLGWGRGLALSDAGKRVLAGNQMLSVGVRNSPEWASANAAADGWRARLAFLIETDNALVACRKRKRNRLD